MSDDQTPITGIYGHGGITLTAYPSSGRVGVEVTAENAVMDYSDLLDFADQIRKPREVTTAAELNALPEGSIVRDRSGLALQRSILGWNCINGVRDIRREELERDAFPATVLHEPAP